MTRYLYGIGALILWTLFISYCMSKGIKINSDMQLLSMSIVVAGAMAGGD